MRCLKALVSTMFRLAMPWFSADDGEVSCSRNLQEKKKKKNNTVLTNLLPKVETGVCVYTHRVCYDVVAVYSNVELLRKIHKAWLVCTLHYHVQVALTPYRIEASF